MLPQRNPLLLCQATEEARADRMDFVVTFVGDGPARPELEEFAAGTSGRVRVLPPVSHQEVPDVLAEAHLGVTALWAPEHELFQASSPVKLFEYMAAGLPVLAMRMPCHADVVCDGEYAFWVEQPDVASVRSALRQVWRERDSLSRLGSEAARAARAWTWHMAAKKLKLALEHGLAG